MAAFLKKSPLFLVFLFVLANCGWGTETGNPIPGPNAGNPCPAYRIQAQSTADQLDDELTRITEQLCLSFFICDNNIHTLDCVGVLDDDASTLMPHALNTDTEYFTNAGVYADTVGQLHEALSIGTVVMSAEIFDACTTAIESISCEAMASELDLETYEGVDALVPPACEFSLPTMGDPNSAIEGGNDGDNADGLPCS